jgi:hypothetical protein
MFLGLRQADGDVDGQHLEALNLSQKIGQGLGDGGTIKVAITEHNDDPAAFCDVGSGYEGHGGRVAEFGIRNSEFGIAYPFDPGKSSVITSVGLGDPVKSGCWEVVHGDDRGGGRDLSAVICEAGGAELELGGPRVGHRNAELELGGPRIGGHGEITV